ncbi:MAG: OmpP1/FadL family transporter [Thermodesulfobacteriota bacterium]
MIFCFYGKPEAGTPFQGAKAAGMAAAFVAIADDPSALLHNPGGLPLLEGTRVYAGATAIIGSTEFENPAGETEESGTQVFLPFHLYLTSDLKRDDLAVGFGIYSPFGIGGREWPEDGLTRYLTTDSLISTLSASPVVAYRVFPWLSMGAGFYYMHAWNEAERKVDQSALGAEDAAFSLEGDGGGFGYNFGILLFPERRFSFGAAYRSKADVDQDIKIRLENLAPALQSATGRSDIKVDADGTLDFPEVLSVGAAYRPTEALVVCLEFEWTGWSRFERLALDLHEEIPQAGLTDFAIDFDYEDIWFIKIGADYKINHQFSIRGGYAYVSSPVPTRALNPGNPDADQHNVSLGLGYRTETWTLDFFYMADFYETRHTDNPALTGKYENFSHFAGLSFGYRF